MLTEELPVLAGELPLTFQKVDGYTTFFVEYTFKDGDIHFHFFQTPESRAHGAQYWKLTFPKILDEVARKHFEAEYPRLQASHVEGVLRHGTILQEDVDKSENSWWFIAQEFENVPDPNKLIEVFLDKFDQALDSAIRT